jgi:hypothetical protein
MLQHVINKEAHLEVVTGLANDQALAEAIQTWEPQWVIFTAPIDALSYSWIQEYPSVGFIFLSLHENFLQLRRQPMFEEKYSDISLKDFIHILEKDLQHI